MQSNGKQILMYNLCGKELVRMLNKVDIGSLKEDSLIFAFQVEESRMMSAYRMSFLCHHCDSRLQEAIAILFNKLKV